MKVIVAYIVCLLPFLGYSQDSIIFHSGFEENTQPVYATNHLSDINSVWFSAWKSPDIFSTSYASAGNGVPLNVQGYQNPFKDNSYGGFITYTKGITGSPIREWLGVRLPLDLRANEYYCFRAYISLGDTVGYATGNIGIYFSSDSIYMPLPFPPPAPLPTDYSYVVSTPINQLFYSKTVWVEINLTYQAKGDEKYMYLGNFSPDSLIDYQYVGTDGDSTLGKAYYYIDEVSLYKCDGVGLEESTIPAIELYPNPVGDILTIKTPKPVILTLFNALGQRVLSSTQAQVDCSALPNGMYVVQLQQGNNITNKRVVIQH